MAHDEGLRIALHQAAQQAAHGALLGAGAGVLGLTVHVEATFVTDADGVVVMAGAVGANLRFGPARLDGAVAQHDVVIAYAFPAAGAVPAVNLLGGGALVGPHAAAMDNEEGNGTHGCYGFTR